MNAVAYLLNVLESGEIVRTDSRSQSIAAHRDLRARLGPHVEIRLVVRRQDEENEMLRSDPEKTP